MHEVSSRAADLEHNDSVLFNASVYSVEYRNQNKLAFHQSVTGALSSIHCG
jgi:hypothetical protein